MSPRSESINNIKPRQLNHSSLRSIIHFNFQIQTLLFITMHFTNVILAVMATATVAIAAPAQQAGSGTASAQVSCPSGWVQCGVCLEALLCGF